MSKEHTVRLVVILMVLLAVLASVVYLAATGAAPELRARLEGALVVLIPAVLDSGRVAQQQRAASAKLTE